MLNGRFYSWKIIASAFLLWFLLAGLVLLAVCNFSFCHFLFAQKVTKKGRPP